MNEIFDKEEWASRKQQDREAAYAMVDDTLKKMGTNGKAFQTYLDVQSKFERYSVSNALLVAAQKPEATDLGDANFWRGRGGYIRKGESGILLMEPGNSYTRKDGSKGVNIHVKRVFDISQTTLTPTKQPAVSQDTRLLLNAMVRYAPCKVDFRDELPDGQSALYSPQEKTVFVRRGQSMEDVFRGVAQELAHAYLDTGNYSRENNIFLAQCVGNILCQRNGQIERADNAAGRRPERSDGVFRHVRLQLVQTLRVYDLQLLYAVFYAVFIQRAQLRQVLLGHTHNKRAVHFERKIKILRKLRHHEIAFEIHFCHQASVRGVEACVDNGAVGLGGAAAHILCLFQHQHPSLIAGQVPRDRAAGNACADNDDVVQKDSSFICQRKSGSPNKPSGGRVGLPDTFT